MSSQAKPEAQEANPPTCDKSKNFHQRVEEFSMWKDESAFRDMEYKRRRDLKKQIEGTIGSDNRLVLSNRLYIPVILLILIGLLDLLLSSLERVGGGTFFWENQQIFQILGGVLLGLGLVSLMAVAAYTYHREDKVRQRYGYPSLFTSSLKGEPSTKNMEEAIMLQNTFVERPRPGSSVRLSRLDSLESKSTSSNLLLTQSFSSTSTAQSWVHKHRQLLRPPLRRESSDSALDKIFARNRLFWQDDDSNCVPDNCIITDRKEEANVDTLSSCDHTKDDDKCRDASQVESSVSMASSGYCSNTSTNGIASQNNPRTLFRHLSEPAKTEPMPHRTKRCRMMSDGVIPVEDIFEEQHSVTSNVPAIRIEC